jgi:SAM-dependent methyltransferase
MTTATEPPPASPATAIACASCGSITRTPVFTGLTDYLTGELFDIQRCAGCGLMITHPLPVGDGIGRFYPPRYRGDRHGFTGRLRVWLRCRAIESCFPRGFRGRLLDVGCGDGSFAVYMHNRGWEVAVTEIDLATIDRLRLRGIDAKQSHDAVADGFAKPFDAITSWHVMEHVEHPLQTAEWVRSQLKPEGIFQATVPNAGSTQARLFGKHWIHLDVPRHRHHFTPTTFRAILEQTKLKPIQQANFAIEYDWFGVIQSTLNLLSTRPNLLFDKLTHAQSDTPPSLADLAITLLASGPIAMISLPPLLIAALIGDGATLTLTCRQ